MIKNSPIEWTGPSWNPWSGCVKKTIEIGGQIKLREECRNCYMYRQKKQYGQRPEIVIQSAPATFNKPLKIQKEYEQGKRPNLQDRLIFTCSWSDWFNPEADEWRPEAWEVIRQCPDLIFQILTKLIDRAKDHLPPFWNEIKNRIWIGTSAGYQEAADWAIPHLLKIDARVRFLSCEPLLGPIDLRQWLNKIRWPVDQQTGLVMRPVDWVIAGGESGPKSRPMHPEWIRGLRDQCQAAGVPFFLKQWGEWIPKTEAAHLVDGDWRVKPEWLEKTKGKQWGNLDIGGKYLEGTTTWNGRQNDPQDDYEVIVYRVGKKAAGRLLDGQKWDEFPA